MKRELLILLASHCSCSVGLAQEPDQPPAIRIRLSRPDQQLEEVLRLFEGSKAASPASALVAWKRANPNTNQLGKPIEALIASLNPKMVAELRTLDAAEVSMRFDPATGQPVWSAILPHDDGTFAAVASALVLSGGAADAPLGEVAVDRLAGPGSVLMAKVPGATLLSNKRDGLLSAQGRVERPRDLITAVKDQKGVRVLFEPGALQGSKSLQVNRAQELLRPSNAVVTNPRNLAHADFVLDRGTLATSLLYDFANPFPKTMVNPAWFDWTPKDRAVACFGFATEPGGESWESLYALANRIEKLDPARANVAPLQVRLDLLSRLAGLRLDADLLRHLRGVSGWAGTDEKAVNCGLLLFHLDDHETAERIVAGVKPVPSSGPRPAGEPDRPRWLGKLDGQPLRITRFDRTVALCWGDGVLEASLTARDDPERSAGPIFRRYSPVGQGLFGAGIVWPERLPQLGPGGSPVQKSLDQSSPLVWQLNSNDGFASLVAKWSGLDQTVRRFLDRIPLDPPPDH